MPNGIPNDFSPSEAGPLLQLAPTAVRRLQKLDLLTGPRIPLHEIEERRGSAVTAADYLLARLAAEPRRKQWRVRIAARRAAAQQKDKV
jgi:hypothetical protein